RARGADVPIEAVRVDDRVRPPVGVRDLEIGAADRLAPFDDPRAERRVVVVEERVLERELAAEDGDLREGAPLAVMRGRRIGEIGDVELEIEGVGARRNAERAGGGGEGPYVVAAPRADRHRLGSEDLPLAEEEDLHRGGELLRALDVRQRLARMEVRPERPRR